MKKVEVTLYGEEIGRHERTFILELPDDIDVSEFTLEALSELADENGICWEGTDWDEVEASHVSVSEVGEGCGWEVIKWEEEEEEAA